MNLKNSLVYILLFLGLAISAAVSSISFAILNMSSGLGIGIILLEALIAAIFFHLNLNKKLYFGSIIILLVSGSILSFILYPRYDLVYFILYLSLISLGLIFAILIVTVWEKQIISNKKQGLLKKLMKSLRENNFQEVLDYSNRILEIDSNNYWALSSKAGSLKMLGNYHDALEICNSFIEKNPKDRNFLNLKVDCLINLNQIEEAEEVNQKILSKNSKDMVAISNKAQILYVKGFYNESLKYFEKYLKNNYDKERWIFMGLKPMKMIPVPKEIAKIWLSKGLAHKNLQQYSKALESFNKALEFDPDSLEAQKNKDEVSGLLQGI